MIATLRACALGLVLLSNTVKSRAADQTIKLELGRESVFELESSFETILISDPDVVDVHAQTERSVILEPLNLGAANIVFLDARQMAIANIRVFVCNAIRTKYREGPDCE
jgi:Flp pilus assembly secretin CpaC